MATSRSINRQAGRRSEPPLIANRYCDKEKEINILLLGQTGVGKTTFINAFANYIVNNTLEEAVNDEIQTIISSSFSYTDPDTFQQKTITIGDENEYEQVNDIGKSNTQKCRSFVFPIGNRNLRFIDTPGVGDTKGADQDEKNFQEILDYISQYEHLNAMFILFKPNEERLTVLFRYCVNELLRHINVGAKDNIVFIFTNARSTFFMPGTTSTLLRSLLDQQSREHNIIVPFTNDNTFLFDNEAFRYLALRKRRLRVNHEETNGYTTSWDHSVKEYSRLMEHVNKCPIHPTSNALSLNEAEQLVRSLPRPLAETARHIEENIQLAKDHKKRVLENHQSASEGIPQKDAIVDKLRHPRTVCTGDRCCQVVGDGKDKKMKYISICHDHCYLNGVQQETLNNPHVGECEVMDPFKGFCTKCKCRWEKHKHITYEYSTRLTHIKSASKSSTTTNKELTLSEIDKRISDLREEERQIQDAYNKMVRFLHVNSILPINDGYIEYLQYFIHEEQMKQTAGSQNTEIIANLEKMIVDYKNEMELFKKTLKRQQQTGQEPEILQPEEVFALAGTLYHLPINGKQIRAQVNEIKIGQGKYAAEREKFIELPAKAAASRVMLQLKDIVESKK